MKIVLTGGGSGGHFYPLIAVAQDIQKIAREEKLLGVDVYYFSNAPYNGRMLLENNIKFVKVSAGKRRRYFSLLNYTDMFKTAKGVIKAVFELYKIYPDVVLGKGGYASFPTLFAARFLRIPVVIHESDSVPGRVNLWASKFSEKIAISFSEAGKYFPERKTALTGNPIRNELKAVPPEGAREFFKLEEGAPVVLILGGSQGSETINDALIDVLPDLVQSFEVIHQTGPAKFKLVKDTANLTLMDSNFKTRYHAYEYLANLPLKIAAGAASVAVSRAGSTIFELAAWGLPAILIPISDSNGDHQRQNALAYAKFGACTVIEEANLTKHVLLSEIARIVGNAQMAATMRNNAKNFAKIDAGEKIARALINIALRHEV